MKKLTYAAVAAAIYCAVTLLLMPICYGPIQCRVSEALTLLPAISPVFIPSVFIGCLISNLFMGNIFDVILGSAASLIAACLTYFTRKNIWIAASFPVIVNALFIGYYFAFIVGVGQSFIVCALWIALGEAVACYCLGIPLYYTLKKFNFLKKM